MEETDTTGAPAAPAEAIAPPPPPLVKKESKLCAVKFRDAGRTYDYDPGTLELKRGDLVLVDFAETRVIGIVSRARSLAQNAPQNPPKIVRKLDDADKAKLALIADKEKEAFKFALIKLRQRNLPAKMVAAELSFNEDKLTFYVASEDRIDLRHWVRDVSTEFRARVDVRQIGARDAAKFIGGVGSCGRELCCSTWLVDFRPVSIKMAKDQNLALNPDKVSGQCGRLLCCLTYEQDTYRDMRKGLPKIGKRVYTPMGDGRVKDVNVLRRKVRVQLLEGYEEFDAEQVSPMFGQKGELLEPNLGAPSSFEEEDDESEDGAGEGAQAKPASAPSGSPAPRAQEARRDERPRPDQQRSDQPRGERPPRDQQRRDDRPPRPQGDRPPQGDRNRPQGDRPPRDERNRPQGDRPPRDDRNRPQGDRPPRDDRNRPQGDRPPRDDRNRPQGDRPPRDDRNRPLGDRPPRDDRNRPQGDRPPRDDRNRGPQGPRPQGERPPRENRPPQGERPPQQEPRPVGEPGAEGAPPPEGGEGGLREDGTRRRRRRRGRGGRGGGGGGPQGQGPQGGGGAPPSGAPPAG